MNINGTISRRYNTQRYLYRIQVIYYLVLVVAMYKNKKDLYHIDHLGSTSLLTDSSAAVREHLEYTPWHEQPKYKNIISEVPEGVHEQPKYKNIISEVPEGVGESWYENGGGTNYKFTGKELDPTGLYYFGARYYDPQVSLWMSTDSVLNTYLNFKINKGISNSKNLSLYAYSLLNPINFLDPDGNAAVGDAVFFNWKGFSHPRHVAIVTEVDSAGIPTKAYGLWAQPSGPSEYQTKDLTQIREDGKTYQEFMIGSGKMEGLTSSDIETVKIDFDEKTQDWEGNWEGDEEGFVCIDVITNNDIGLGGEKIRDAMKSDMEKNQDSYSGIDEIIKKDGKINTNNNFNYRKNTILMQFFINQEKFEKIPEKE